MGMACYRVQWATLRSHRSRDDAIGRDRPGNGNGNCADSRTRRGFGVCSQEWVARCFQSPVLQGSVLGDNVSGVLRVARMKRRLNRVGTRNSVEQARRSAPITARQRNVLPRPMAIGSSRSPCEGRHAERVGNRVVPLPSPRLRRQQTRPSRPRAKDTIRMLFAVATPMHMIAPVSAGTDSVVPVVNNIPNNAGDGVGSARMITNGSSQD